MLKQRSTGSRKTASLSSKHSEPPKLEEPLVPPQLIVEDDESEESDSSISHSQSELYIPPGAELPCECLYDSDGRLIRMKALCPEHG